MNSITEIPRFLGPSSSEKPKVLTENAAAEQSHMPQDRVAVGDGLALGGCCIGPMMSNATKVGDATSNTSTMKGDSGVGVSSGAGNIASTVVTTYFATGSAIASAKTFINYNRLISRANGLLDDLNLLSQVHGETNRIVAMRRYVEGERRTFRFQACVAGGVTALDSTALGIGQYVRYLYPAALFGASAESFVRIGDCGRFVSHGRDAVAMVEKGTNAVSSNSLPLESAHREQLIKRLRMLHDLDLLSEKELRMSKPILNGKVDDVTLRKLTYLRADQRIVREHFSEQSCVAGKNAGGWTLIGSGTATMGTSSILKNGSEATAKKLVIASGTQIGLGVGITYRYNPKLYGAEFSPGIPERLSKPIESAVKSIREALNVAPEQGRQSVLASLKKSLPEPEFFTDEEIREELIKSQRLHVVAHEYQEGTKTHFGLAEKGAYGTFVLGKHLFSLLTVGALPSKWYANLNRYTKEIASGWYANERGAIAKRLAFVQRLHPEYRQEQAQELCTSDDEKTMEAYEELLTDARNPAVGGVVNILLRRILESAPRVEGNTEEPSTNHIQVGDSRYRIKSELHDIFEFRNDAENNADNEANKELAESVIRVLTTPPCCDSGSDGAFFLGQLFDRYAKKGINEHEQSLRSKFAMLLQHSIDQYMKYQLPADRVRERCFWGNLAHVTGASKSDDVIP